MKLSVVVPVYNVEKYLAACVDSILPQMGTSDELILVDDGSTDTSGSICDKYAFQDTRIRVIHQKNAGLSGARNRGMEAVTGDYLYFVDSDDFLDPDTFDRVRKLTEEKPDLIFCRGYFDYPSGECREITGSYDSEALNGVCGITALAWFCRNVPNFFWSASAAFCRTEFLRQHGFRFPEHIMMEDLAWTFRLYPCAKKCAFMEKPCYHYRQGRTGSIMTSVRLPQIQDMFTICEKLDAYYRDLAIDEMEKLWIRSKFGHLIASASQKIPFLKSRSDRKKAYDCLESLKGIIWSSRYPAARTFRMLWTCLGMRGAVLTLGLRRWLRSASERFRRPRVPVKKPTGRFYLVTATIGRVREVEELFTSLAKQTYRDFQVVLCDQNPDGRLDAIVRRFQDQFAIEHLKLPAKGVSIARNEGIRHLPDIDGILAFPDDDCLYEPDTLEKVHEHFEEKHSLTGICGIWASPDSRFDIFPPRKVTRMTAFWRGGTLVQFFRLRKGKKKLLFDPDLGPGTGKLFGCGEDTDYLLNMLKRGPVFRFSDVHLRHPEQGVSLSKLRSYAIGRMYLLKKHRFSLLFRFLNVLYPLVRIFMEPPRRWRYRFLMFRERLSAFFRY